MDKNDSQRIREGFAAPLFGESEDSFATTYQRFIESLISHFDADWGFFVIFAAGSNVNGLRVGPLALEEHLSEPDGAWFSRLYDVVRGRGLSWTGPSKDILDTEDGTAVLALIPQCTASHAPGDCGPAGVLVLLRNDRQRGFEPEDGRALALFASQGSLPIAQLRELSLKAGVIEQQRLLAQIAALLNSEQDPGVVRERSIDAVRTLLGCEASSLILRESETGRLVFDVATGEVGERVKSLVLEPDEGIAGWVISKARTYSSNSLTDDPLHSKRVDAEAGFQSHSIICVPLAIHGRVMGALQAVNARDGAFREADVKTLEQLGQQVATALDNARLNRQLRESLATLKRQQDALIQAEKLSAMGLLSAGVAHEIKSPLTAISGYAQLLRRNLPGDSPLSDKLVIIERSVGVINRICNGLLEFAKKDDTCWEDVSINEVLSDALELAEHTLSRFKKVKIERSLTQDLPLVEADKRQLQQVFLNLILNAAEAMRGGGTLTIATKLDARDGVPREQAIPRVEISFADTGPGISDLYREKVFEPFFTEGKKSGTGLGLSICKTIMKKHRGEITFQSPDEGGTTFLVYVPVLEGQRAVAHAMEDGRSS